MFRCGEEPGGFDGGVGGELLGGKAEAGVFDPSEEGAVLAAPAVFVFIAFVFGVDAYESEVVADGVAELLAPGVVFGEVEFKAGAGVVGGDFASVADEVAEKVGGGFGLGDGSEVLVPFGHVVVGQWGELVEDGGKLGPVGDLCGNVDELGGVEASFHAEGEPLVARFWWYW